MTQVASLVDKNEKQKIVLIPKESSKEKNLSEEGIQQKELTKKLVKKNIKKTARHKRQGIDLEVKMTESIANTWGPGEVCAEGMTKETIT